MADDAPYRDADTLRELHFEENLTAPEMADRLGTTKKTIHHYLKRHDIDYDRNRGKPWYDEDRLRELYHEQGLSSSEVAGYFECSATAIRTAMENLGIERRPRPQDEAEGALWRDEDKLRELYLDRNLLTREIAERADCTTRTIIRWLDRFGIERRDGDHERARAMWRGPARFVTTEDGYERWESKIFRQNNLVYVHRLLAVAEYGFDAVSDMDVHHRNGIPWDNRAENIDIISREDHGRKHAEERWANAG